MNLIIAFHIYIYIYFFDSPYLCMAIRPLFLHEFVTICFYLYGNNTFSYSVFYQIMINHVSFGAMIIFLCRNYSHHFMLVAISPLPFFIFVIIVFSSHYLCWEYSHCRFIFGEYCHYHFIIIVIVIIKFFYVETTAIIFLYFCHGRYKSSYFILGIKRLSFYVFLSRSL